MKQWFPKVFYNPISLIGSGIAMVSLGTISVFFITYLLGGHITPYAGIITFIILPAIMIFGLLLIPIGMIRERRWIRRSNGLPRRYLVIDFNQHNHKVYATFFSVTTLLLILISAVGSYHAYNFTESVEFCGLLCHKIMSPEYIAFQNSPHARVACASCHIGEGAGWFVKSKLSGTYQVYATLTNSYPRPIPTPVKSLRPARETCEQCHWPQKFHGDKEFQKTYFKQDEQNSPWQITMLIHTGGGMSELGPTNGIHWHMNIANKVEYIATDERRQVIPWVKTKSPDGKELIFKSTEEMPGDSVLAAGEKRVMDCVDCHNRPTHIYYPPFRTINDALAINHISPTLPNIRVYASAALTQHYTSTTGAADSIALSIENNYRQNQPEIYSSRKADIDQAIQEVQEIYRRNFFPVMKVSWKEYPNNIGHLYDNGCFRCHDGKHVTEDGKKISNDCQSCHNIIAQGPSNKQVMNLAGLEFQHPVDIGDAWKEENCVSCHTGE